MPGSTSSAARAPAGGRSPTCCVPRWPRASTSSSCAPRTPSTTRSCATPRPLARAADEAGALFVLNDRPDLVAAADADGVHVGQDDVPVGEARAAVGAARVFGLSTHSIAQADAADGADVDYFAVGPVHATPTKEGRPAIGLEPVAHAARTATHPWFAIGGPRRGHNTGGARRRGAADRRGARDRRGGGTRARSTRTGSAACSTRRRTPDGQAVHGGAT